MGADHEGGAGQGRLRSDYRKYHWPLGAKPVIVRHIRERLSIERTQVMRSSVSGQAPQCVRVSSHRREIV